MTSLLREGGDRVLLVSAYWRTNLTMRQLAPLFGISKSAVGVLAYVQSRVRMNVQSDPPPLPPTNQLALDLDLSSFADGPFDVRAAVAAIRPETKDGFLLDQVPWEHFPQGEHVKEAVHLLHTEDSLHTGKGVVNGMCANGMRAAAVLAVPFRIRIAANTRHPYRGDALAEASGPARARYSGVASRDELPLHRADTQDGDLYDDYGVEVTGYPAGRSPPPGPRSPPTPLSCSPFSATPTRRYASTPPMHWPPPQTPTARSVLPSVPGLPPSRTRSSEPPWSSPPPKPPALTPTRRPPHGSESSGGCIARTRAQGERR